MITTAAADTLAGLFAGAPATAGDIAGGSGPVFGRMLATNVAVPAAATVMPPFRTIPGIATLPIGTLVGTGSLPFSASSMPAALAWSASKLPLVPGGMTTSSDTSVATLSAPVLNMPPSPTSLPAAVSASSLPTAIKQVEPVAVVPIRPIADEVASAAAVTRTGPRTEAPWRDEVIVDQPVPHIDPAGDQESITASPGSAAQGGGVKTGPIRVVDAPIPSSADVTAALPVADSKLVLGDEQAPLPGTAENVICEEIEPGVGEAPVEVTHATPVSADIPAVMIDPAMAMTEEKRPQPVKTANVKPVESGLVTPETPVATTPATLSPGETPTPRSDQGVVVANARTPSSGRIGTARRTETRDATPEKSVAADSDIPMVPIPLALSTAPSVTPVIVSKGDDPAVPDEDASDTSDPKPVEDSVSPAGAIPLPIEMAVVPAKTALATIVTERPVAASAPTLHPASIAAEPVDGPPSTAVDTSDIVLSNPNTAPRADGVTHEEARVGESRQPMAQPASFATLVNRAEPTAAPAPTAAVPAPPAEPRVAAQPGRMGQEMGVAIARHAATGGGEAMTVRLDPVEFGRIEVTLSFDDSGTIRAVVAAESPAALDLLRRDSADLGRSLAEAGIRSDAQSFRFDTRQGSADGSGQGGQRWQQQSAAGTRTVAQATDDNPEPVYRPLRTQGRVDLMA